MKSSRSSANIVSARTNDARRANQVRTVWTSRNPARTSTSSSTYARVVPSVSDWTSSPTSHGAARPVAAAVGVQGEHDGQPARGGGRRGGALAPRDRRARRREAARSRRSSSSPRVTVSRYPGLRRSSRCRPTATTRPSSRYATVSARSRTSGLAVMTTVVKPARAACSRSAIRASVWASTALVGSTRTRISGVGEQRADEREPLALAAGEGARTLVDRLVEPLRQRLEHVLRRGHGHRGEDLGVGGTSPGVENRPERAGEQHRIRLADDDARPHRVERQVAERDAAERDAGGVGETAEAVRERRGLVRAGGDDARERARARRRARTPRRRAAAPVGGPSTGASGSATAGSTASTSSIRRAPTSARVILSTASAAVRSGMTRNAA